MNEKIMPEDIAVYSGYDTMLRDVKARVRAAQIRAALAVNSELVRLYWQVGHDISRQIRANASKIINNCQAGCLRAVESRVSSPLTLF